jgi:multicomponent Na+:H+ antiporter subunit D
MALVLAALLMKAAAFPLSAWLPATYPTLSAPVVALFAALGTKAGIYAILRLRGEVFTTMPVAVDHALGWIAVITMVTGVLGAAHHWDMRRILAFHSVSQVGYMLLGIALGTAGGAQGTIVFAVHHSLVKANLFLIAALVCRSAGGYDLRKIGGVAAAKPWLAGVFLSQALSLVGLPPLSGFWGKLTLVRESLILGHRMWATIALAVGVLTLYSMLKIWFEAFWKPDPRPQPGPLDRSGQPALATGVVTGLAALTVLIGLWPDRLLRYALLAAQGLGFEAP